MQYILITDLLVICKMMEKLRPKKNIVAKEENEDASPLNDDDDEEEIAEREKTRKI